MKYGYARVSTAGQDLESQIQKLKEEGCKEIYSEHFTGTCKNRPEFTEVLSLLKKGDTLVVTKLDRFARSAMDAIKTVRDLFERGVRVHIINMGIVENTSTGRLLFTVMSGFAEFERDMIIERTQEGKAVAKQRADYREGRPKKYSKVQMEHALELLKTHSYNKVAEMTGISKSTLIRAMQKYKTEHSIS